MARGRLPVDRRTALPLLGLAALAVVMRAVPLMRGGGLLGLHGYDDGVYYGAASAAVHGVLPYRDFLFLHPPGIVVLLAPFAAVGAVLGDTTGFALARLSILLLGALNTILVAVVAGRRHRLAGLLSGGLYAVWASSAIAERTTDLHGPQCTLALVALLALTSTPRPTTGRALLAGIAIGLAVSVQLWQGATAVVLLWWVLVRARGVGWKRLRPAAAYLVGAGTAFAAVCLPLLVVAPEAMLRYTLADQFSRPNNGIDVLTRLRTLEGLPGLVTRLPGAIADPLIALLAACALAAIIATARWCPWSRPWAVLAMVQIGVLLATPSFFPEYPSFAAQSIALVLGTGAAAAIRRVHAPPRLLAGVVVAVLVAIAAPTLVRRDGQRLPLDEIARDLSGSRCVSADSPALLVLSSALHTDLQNGCPIVLDPTGTRYDTDRGALLAGPPGASSRAAAGYQRAMVAWYGGSDAALFTRATGGLSADTLATIRHRLPVTVRHGSITVCLAH